MNSTDEPKLSLGQAQLEVSKKTFPRVTEQSIKARIADVEYVLTSKLLTIAIITMDNGFMVTGVSAAADTRNFDADIGQRYAFDNAFKQLWQLEGYLLREKLNSSARFFDGL